MADLCPVYPYISSMAWMVLALDNVKIYTVQSAIQGAQMEEPAPSPRPTYSSKPRRKTGKGDLVAGQMKDRQSKVPRSPSMDDSKQVTPLENLDTGPRQAESVVHTRKTGHRRL